jgi:proteasome lid subunit RPN8/RPN11
VTALQAVSIAIAVKRAVVAHARREAPKECCGFLIGAGDRVDLAVPMANIDPHPQTGFRIDPSEHIAVRRVLRQVLPDATIVGVYHSHPSGPAAPSPRDLAEAHYPEWSFLICGRKGRVIRAFRIQEGVATPVAIRWRPAVGRRSKR